ncbi:carbon-oxygen lyase-like protein [Microdochium trichocladiopsis]|uniref:Rhamnogalacturonate lyase n=1 Tax=Microdochium trichocladiopsis TaxID=1682393 RepID=A0A9P8XVW8_9PEZI|nr:carbon-oxygen lyase-like protein [Microdochium trichocladiopsis]KAH7017989.1 carbon-oxygen lyase-like protein [Microdochium trichocladiopsis]
MLLQVLLTTLLACVAQVWAITVSTTSASYVIDAQSENAFVVTISRSTCDITSLRYRGIEYQYSGQFSHIGSGLGSGTAVSYSTSPSGNTVIVRCGQTGNGFNLAHYMVLRHAEPTIYMGTQTNAEPSIGELRYIFRLTGLFSSYPFGDASNTVGSTSAVEGSDVYIVNGQTRSKFYSSERFIDDRVYCSTDSGATVHACFVRPNHQATEKSSGGPFFRDINTNPNGAYTSLTYYMNSGHVQTEAFRQGFHGPYVFTMTRSGIPSAGSFDLSWFDSLGLQGYVPISGNRGYVSGTASGVSTAFPIVVHWFNSGFQFWTYASSNGAFGSPPMPAGTYTMNLYQDELLAATASVSVTAGRTTSQNIAATNPIITQTRTKIFQLGDYDGQPTGFRNAANQLRMHPSDTRMASWTPGTVPSNQPGTWPMAIFKNVNNGQKISFSLSSALARATTLRIATTLSFAGGRPQASVNGFTCPAPSAPPKIDSRGVTRVAYRGNGEVYTCTVPAGTLVAGANTVTINVISGSDGATFLSPNVVFDAIELFY